MVEYDWFYDVEKRELWETKRVFLPESSSAIQKYEYCVEKDCTEYEAKQMMRDLAKNRP